ncbi:DUF2155 domain-containing protein [Pacificimonas sp. WHA3]|uniref:DUF2155 domain-containing protein n=1 Tax=Pacificimonas pallii TaxID=2827236 RepID=A0ABS6SHZ2_9SPHN|nr:DUF2155 domain-containing protein [Pacificimonas pallii]MBV7257546.1 DUF2155 domain-containing protein [Pacificimonas pallii]
MSGIMAGICGAWLLAGAAAAQSNDESGGGPDARSGTTPMAERTVIIGVLDKASQATETIETNPGKTVSYRGLTIAVRACEATPPWAAQKFVGGFLQVDYTPRRGADPARVFSGWLYANTPSLNSFDHPNYDVWVSACKMDWPETGPDTILVK